MNETRIISLLRCGLSDSPAARPPVGGESSQGPVSRETAEDLGLDQAAGRIATPGISRTSVREILLAMPTDPACIRYRQDVFRDLYESPDLCSGIDALMPLFEELTSFHQARRDQESPLLQALMRLGELELYVECVDRLHRLLAEDGERIGSEGLKRLRQVLSVIMSEESFATLSQELPRLRQGLKVHRSITVGVNLDDRLRPVEAAILSVNDTAFTRQSLLSRLFNGPGGYVVTTPLHTNPGGGDIPWDLVHLPLAPLFQDLDGIIRANSRQIISAVESFIRVNTGILSSLHTELGFYLGAVHSAHELVRHGLPVCIPEIIDRDERFLSADDFYNLLLADRFLDTGVSSDLGAEIVLNRVRFNEEGRIFILTGPNQGGKTTYTQGIGLLQIFAQAGIFVTASHAVVSPVDRVETHFPSQEKGRLDTGRLSEEASRLQSVFRDLTPGSLVLLNESLSSTSPAEGMLIAEDLIRALRFLGARAVFATHFHDLAFRTSAMNSETEGGSVIASLTAGAFDTAGNGKEVKRSFLITPGPPAGLSFARDIADKFGLSLPRLSTRFQSRKLRTGNPTAGLSGDTEGRNSP